MADPIVGNPVNPGGARQTPYDIGGQAPYGFMQTPGYTALWNPILTPGQGLAPVNEVALYERMDWQNAIEGYTNPPFIGVGSSNNAVPKYMQTADGVARILRGYIRRSRVAAWSPDLYDPKDPQKTSDDRATNARLYFMYNPSEVARQYVSYGALAGQASTDTESGQNLGQGVPALVTMNLSLFFDRQEEVARFANHPGVLVDLSVFDMLIGNKRTSYDDIVARDKAALAGGHITATPSLGTADAPTLKPNIDFYLTIIMSPTIVFEGRIMEASALFQKFSHRMTPTQMTITLTLLLDYTGQLMSTGVFSPTDAAAAAAVQATYAEKTKINPPGYKADSSAAALQLNYEGRGLAVTWAEQWTAAAQKKFNGPGAPYPNTYGVYYNNTGDPSSGRCGNWQNDDLVKYQSPNDPAAFDCSSLIWRAYNVIGWVERLKLSTACGSSSDDFLKKAQQNSDVWSAQDVTFNTTASGGGTTGYQSMYEQFNAWDPQKTGQKGPNRGDLLVRTVGSHHIAFIASSDGNTGGDPGAWKWTLLESTDYGHPVETVSTTTAAICGQNQQSGYQFILRAHPITS